MQLDFNTVSEYCKCLSASAGPGASAEEIWTWWLKNEGEARPVPGFGCFSCTVSALPQRLAAAPASDGWSLHACLNVTDLDKRRTENIRGVRCLCVDLDRVVSAEEIRETADKYKPDMVVQSSPGKYHLYWRIAPMIKLEAWKLYQMGLAEQLQGDLNMNQLAHTIRVPGCGRRLKDGTVFMPEIVRLEAPRMRTDAGIRAEWPWILDAAERGAQRRREEARIRQERLLGAGLGGSAAVFGAGGNGGAALAEGSRNCDLYECLNNEVYCGLLASDEAALARGLEINQRYSAPLPESEVISAARSAWNHAAPNREKKQKELSVLLPESDKPAQIKKRKKAARKSANIPMDILDASTALVDLVWSGDPKETIIKIVQSLNSGNYGGINEWFKEQWTEVGRMGAPSLGVNTAPPAIFVQGKNVWGTSVWRSRELTKEQLRSVFTRVCSSIVMRAVDSGKYKKRVRIPPRYSALGSAAEAMWGVFLTSGSVELQASDIIAAQNGVLNLKSGAWISDSLAPKRYSHAIDARFEPQWGGHINGAGITDLVRAKCPVFWRFLEDWFPGDTATKELLLRWFGYCMTTAFDRQKFMFLWGPTGSGKGSLCSILGGLLGMHHVSHQNYGAFGGSGAGAGRFQEAEMYWKLAAFVDEAEGTVVDHAGRFDRIKKHTGGEPVQIERKWGHPFDAIPTAKLTLQSNVAPVYQDTGGAIRGRMITLGCEHSFRDKPTELPPCRMVFESGEMNWLATAAALAWQAAYSLAKPFELEGSRALEIGREAVENEMDLLGSTLRKFQLLDNDGFVSSMAQSDLIKLACSDRGINRPAGTLERDIKAEMSSWRSVRYTRRKTPGKSTVQVRGWSGVQLDREEILKNYDYLVDCVQEYPSLCNELQIYDPSDFSKISMFAEK